ncbi:Uncharacterised protein [Mycobacteroides abscessus subsp. abscessus]|nr:Uncharacterised protein [Mycobacteroides abscessus subsp. abscessus]
MRHPARLLDEGHRFVSAIQIDVGEHHLSTLTREFERGFSTDAATATGDDHQLILKRSATLAHFCPP